MSRAEVNELAQKIKTYLSMDGERPPLSSYLNIAVNGLEAVKDPSEADLPTVQLRCTYRYWRQLPHVDGVADTVKVDPEKVLSALGYLILIDIDGHDDVFRYALYGTRIAEVAGFDMTGKQVWDIDTTSAVRCFFAASYIAARQLRCPIYTVHEAPPKITVSHWHRLILPMGLNGVIQRFLICNVPIYNGEVR